jgi:hypothetical protein
MLAISNKQLNSTFERIVRDKNGVLVRVRFIVVEVNGSFQAQIVSAEAIASHVNTNSNTQSTKPESEVFFFPIFKKSVNFHKEVKHFVESFISPYQPLDFLMSQPTRAPSM